LIAAAAVVLVIVLWRPLAIASFDESFAFSVGIPVRAVQYLLTGLITVAIVISIQAVGVVLVAAMLVTPAATAYLLTDRLHRMAILSAVFGAVAGVAGAFVSMMGDDLPTGALMVLGASSLFALAFLLAPRHGMLPRVWRVWDRRRRTQAENLLRTLFLIMESRGTADRRFGVHDVAAKRQETPATVRKLWWLAASRQWVDRHSRDPIILSDQGLDEARRVVRNHRLWELFLTTEANLASDHVHADAEHIEHVLPRDVLQRLEQMLENPVQDPHGKPIPAR
jgi:manganese/zinc/iron transport system permease protein